MKCESCGHDNIEGARFCASCGIALVLNSANEGWVGRMVGGRFRITRILGEGGMGVVYAGEQQMGSTVRKVAIKTLHPHLSHDPAILARFHRECGTVAGLEHPNTIKVYDFGSTDDGTLYIAMEYVEGRSLDKLIEEGPLAPARVVTILKQIAGALDEAHGQGIVHRDLKPENVVLGARLGNPDFVKVLDFGIAARRESSDRQKEQKLTQQGMVLGTPPYMSPEQFTGEELDRRSDVYSLGVMTYEMLTGRLPFRADTAWQWATEHMTAQPYPMEQTPNGSSIPRAMRDVVLRSLAKQPAARPQTAGEFVQALEAALHAGDARLGVASTEQMQIPGASAQIMSSSGGGAAQGARDSFAGRGSSSGDFAKVPTEGALSATQAFELPVKKANRVPMWVGGGAVLALGAAAFFVLKAPSGGSESASGSGGVASTPATGLVEVPSPPPALPTASPSAEPTANPTPSSGGSPSLPPASSGGANSRPTTPITTPPQASSSGGKSGQGETKPPAKPDPAPKGPECSACSTLATSGQWTQAVAAYNSCDGAAKSQCAKQAKKVGPSQVESASGNCTRIRAVVRGLAGMGEKLPDRPALKAALAKCD